MLRPTVYSTIMRSTLFVTLVALVLSACSGIQETEGQPRDEEGPGRENVALDLSTFETFDPSAYPVQPPERRFDVQHDVPDRLMRGEASKGVQRTVEGFRIQIFSTQEKSMAERRLEEARNWWEERRERDDVPGDLFPEQLPTIIEYRQPYYRVRIGSFAERERAEDALAFVQREYPDAFIARSTVTITR